ncbi:MAG: hypothetical protein LUI60_00935 [Clostridia bacterium]|nr:hypothetical protein [Clostridia bacterium]
MSKKKHTPEPIEQEPVTTKAYIYTAIACGALGAVFYGLMFTAVSIYGLIAGIVFEICALGFSRTQKKKNPVSWGKIVDIICYILLIAGILFMVAGIMYSAIVS